MESHKTKNKVRKNSSKAPKNNNYPKKILVCGDWVVDDYWVIGDHRSLTSTRTGRMHHRSLHNLNATIRAFCGAGTTASLLKLAERNGNKEAIFDIVGIGLWTEHDEEVLNMMFLPENLKAVNPFKLNRTVPSIIEQVKLINIGEVSKKLRPNIDFGTTRVIRSYHQTGDKITQLQRLDWELQAPYISEDGHPMWFKDDDDLSHCINDIPDDIHAVVIKDLGKGVLSKALMTKLVSKYTKVPWFISTKSWKPKWLFDFPNLPLELLIIPSVAAKTALISGEVTCWLTRQGKPSKSALEELISIRNNFSNMKNLKIVVLPENESLLALDWKPNPCEWLIQPDNRSVLPIGSNMASVFFANLIANQIEKPDEPFKDTLIEAFNFTTSWQHHEVKRIVSPESWEPNNSPKIFSSSTFENNYRISGPMDVTTIQNEWKQALSPESSGIINNKRFELWRGMTEVDGYICIVPSKQKRIGGLVREVDKFSKDNSKKQNSCLLYAKPGAGKTSLVRKLASMNDYRFLPFNITQMIKRGDILDCFDTIVTNCLQNSSEPILVFIDEINAKLEGENVYSTFLAPLEDGIYIRGSRSFRLPPCFWMFASTQQAESIRKKEKGSDFISRLTYGEVSLEIESAEDHLKHLENVYLGVSMIQSVYPDVRWVSDYVLKIFRFMVLSTRIRKIRHFVEAFSNVQYGRVRLWNIPTNILSKVGLKESIWKEITNEPEKEIRIFRK